MLQFDPTTGRGGVVVEVTTREIMYQVSKRQRYSPYLWIIFLTFLALIPLNLIEVEMRTRWLSVEAVSTLTPVFSHPGGYYDRDIQLEIRVPNPDADVIFTVDGSVPTDTVGTVYAQPIHLNATTPAVTVIRARAVLPGAEPGPVVSASYFVGVQATLPMISLIVDPDDFWEQERGIYANPQKRGAEWERSVDVTYVDQDRRLGFHVPAGIRIHGATSSYKEKKSLRLYFRQEYGISRLEYPLFAGSEVQSFKRLVLHNGGQDCPQAEGSWTLMRNWLIAELAFQLDGYAPHSRPALVFINGEPQGIYQIRERIDSRFLADHYGVEAADLLESPAKWEERAIASQDREHWDHLMQFVETHDLADPANYAYVQSQIDIANFIDYNILQIYSSNIDWPHHNVNQFRPRTQGGRWHWIFWDNDYSFGLYPSSQFDANMFENVLNPYHPWTGGLDTLLLRKLLANPDFVARFLSRTADLLNTTFAAEPVTAQIDALATELEPDVVYEVSRWSSSFDWKANVQAVRDFARRRPDFVRQHIVEEFGLDGTTQLTFNPPLSGAGYVAVNDTLLHNLPWQGIYFQGTTVRVTAVPQPGYRFAGWDPPDLPQTSIITLTVNNARTLTPHFDAADADAPQPGDVIFAGYEVDDEGQIGGDWFELLVTRHGGVDLRGWRVTDNDTKTAIDEGSLIFTDHPALARVPGGTSILVIATGTAANDTHFPQDDLNAWDQRMVLYVGNGNLDTSADPWFNLGPNDNLVLLAPGPTEAFDDDQGIAFVSEGAAVTPASFGVLSDGVLFASDAQLARQTQNQP
jgi:hypothetical protein